MSLFVLGNPNVEPSEGYVPPQPVMFSHEHHVGRLGISCVYCHTGVEESDFAGIPTPETCMGCHAQLYDRAGMLAPIRAAWQPRSHQRDHAGGVAGAV
ncbi:MAG: cytochrome c3 family protein [Phycisphaerales bacterium]